VNRALVDQLAEAVLYEGYLLYPYRASSKKNCRQRFTFGRVYPEAYSVAQRGAEPCLMQTQCLARLTSNEAALDVVVRFLQPTARQPINGWQRAIERIVSTNLLLPGQTTERSFTFEELRGRVEIASEAFNGFHKITVRILNVTPVPESQLEDSDLVLLRTFASTHTILQVHGGEFISAVEPVSVVCKNIGAWPVLVGDERMGERDVMLSSAIILADYPKIAPESAGTLFDATEIDEILTLRILAMTDEEKREMRNVDAFARQLLERTESLSSDNFLRMHGRLQRHNTFDEQVFGSKARLEAVEVDGVQLKAGGRVRIRPKSRADVIDLALSGKTAVIEAVEQDAEGKVHLAVVLPEDPGHDLGFMRQPGHRFFYGLDEIEAIREET